MNLGDIGVAIFAGQKWNQFHNHVCPGPPLCCCPFHMVRWSGQRVDSCICPERFAWFPDIFRSGPNLAHGSPVEPVACVAGKSMKKSTKKTKTTTRENLTKRTIKKPKKAKKATTPKHSRPTQIKPSIVYVYEAVDRIRSQCRSVPRLPLVRRAVERYSVPSGTNGRRGKLPKQLRISLAAKQYQCCTGSIGQVSTVNFVAWVFGYRS